MTVHERIRQFRELKKLTHQQFADAVGVTRGAVQQWEKEDGTAPNRSRQSAVAKFMGISVAELMATGQGEMLQSGTIPPLYTSGTKHPLAQVDIAQAAINNVADALQILAHYISASPSKGSDALAGTLVSLSKDPGNPIYIDMLGKMLQPPARPGVESTDFQPGVPSLFTKTTS